MAHRQHDSQGGRLKDLIESGYGLDGSTVESEQAVAPGTSKKR